jgi:predicted DNA-binding protein
MEGKMSRSSIKTPRVRIDTYLLANQVEKLQKLSELTGKNRTQLIQDAISQYIYNLKNQGVI